MSPQATLHLSAQAAAAARIRDCDARVIRGRQECGLAPAGVSGKSDLGCVDIRVGLEVIDKAAHAPGESPELTHISGLAPVALGEQSEKIAGHTGAAGIRLQKSAVKEGHPVARRRNDRPVPLQEELIEGGDSPEGGKNNDHRHRTGGVCRSTDERDQPGNIAHLRVARGVNRADDVAFLVGDRSLCANARRVRLSPPRHFGKLRVRRADSVKLDLRIMKNLGPSLQPPFLARANPSTIMHFQQIDRAIAGVDPADVDCAKSALVDVPVPEAKVGPFHGVADGVGVTSLRLGGILGNGVLRPMGIGSARRKRRKLYAELAQHLIAVLSRRDGGIGHGRQIAVLSLSVSGQKHRGPKNSCSRRQAARVERLHVLPLQ